MTLLSEALERLLSLSELVQAHAHARTELVKVSDVIAKVLIEHLPADARAEVGDAVYTVERVTWQLTESRSDPAYPHPFGSFALLRDDVVLADIRTAIVKGERTNARLVGGRSARLARWPEGMSRVGRDVNLAYDLTLAAEDDLLDFADELPAVLDAFAKDLADRRDEFRTAARRLMAAVIQ